MIVLYIILFFKDDYPYRTQFNVYSKIKTMKELHFYFKTELEMSLPLFCILVLSQFSIPTLL